MKKLIQFSLATIFAITLVACDNANQNSNSQNTAKAKTETVLSAKEQFRQDYEAFAKWQNQAQQTFNTEIAKLQQKAAQQAQLPNSEEREKILNAEEGKKLLSDFRNKITEENNKLEALNLKDADVRKLADKMKEVHAASIDAFDFIMQAAGNPKDAQKNMQAIQGKLQKFQTLQIEVQQMSEKLDQQYRQ